MKFNKKSLVVFIICWVVGILGGYYIGVESALLPSDTIEYNYYFSENLENSSVETVESECVEEKKSDCAEDEENNNRFKSFIKSLHLENIPKRIFSHVLSKS